MTFGFFPEGRNDITRTSRCLLGILFFLFKICTAGHSTKLIGKMFVEIYRTLTAAQQMSWKEEKRTKVRRRTLDKIQTCLYLIEAARNLLDLSLGAGEWH